MEKNKTNKGSRGYIKQALHDAGFKSTKANVDLIDKEYSNDPKDESIKEIISWFSNKLEKL